MSLLNNLDNVAFAAPLPVDKIVRTYTGSFSVGAGLTGSTSIAHNLNKKCYPNLSWSIDNSTFYPSGILLYTSTILSGSAVNCVAAIDTNTAYIYANNGTGSSRTFHYRLELIWPV